MSHPEEGASNSLEGVEHEPRFSVTLTRRELDAVLLAITTEINESTKTIASLPNEACRDYDVLSEHIRTLKAIQTALARG